MGLMDMLKTSDPMAKFYAAAEKSNVPQGGITGKVFSAMFPHGLGNLAFGREPEPMPPLETPEGTALMADLASNMMVPGTFIGPKGLARLFGDDAAKGMLATAESKLAQGVPKEAVFQELGVFKGPEGKWRYEIDDSGAKFNPGINQSWGIATEQGDAASRLKEAIDLLADGWPENKVHKLTGYARLGGEGDLVDFRPSSPTRMFEHGELAKAYGPMDDMKMHTMPDDGRTGGYYSQSRNEIGVAGGRQDNVMKSDILHELQHAIQGKEDFARGGSPTAMKEAYSSARARLHFLENDPDFVAGRKKLDKIWDDVFEGKITEEDAATLEAIVISQHPSHQQAKEAMQMMRDNPAQTDAEAMAAYRRLAGEAEARAVQDRMNMSMDERRALFPEYAGRNDLIVRGLMSGGE